MKSLNRVGCEHGAPMGRRDMHNHDLFEAHIVMHLERMPLQDGAYDSGGAYWGSPDNLYHAYCEDEEIEMFLRADSREEAMSIVRIQYSAATFATPELTPFLEAYIVAALWSSNGDDDEPLDDAHTLLDLHHETFAEMAADCLAFQELAKTQLAIAYKKPGYDEPQAGHDFWLTRHHHGAGFWDRGLGKLGDELTELAQTFKEIDLFVTEDGKIRRA